MFSSIDCLPNSAALVDLAPIELKNVSSFRERWFPGTVGAPSDAGLEITHERALGHPAILQGVNLLAGAMAQMKVRLVREVRTPAGGKRIEEVRDHPGAIVARNRSRQRETVNGAVMTICQYRRATMNHAIMCGDGYGAIQRTTLTGDPVQKTLLPPYPATRQEFDDQGMIKVVSDVPLPGGGTKRFELDKIDVFQIQNLSPDGLSGYPLKEIARNPIGQGLAGYKFAGKSFANDARPNGFLSIPGFPKDEQVDDILASWEVAHMGLDNAGKIAALSGGTEYRQTTMSHIDAQLVEYLEADVKTQARILNIPPFLLGVTESSGLKMAEAIAWFIQFTLGDWICNWAEEMRAKLLTEGEWKKGDLRFVFDVSNFLMTNWPEYVKTIVEAVGGPVLQREEGRSLLQVNPDVDDSEFLERSTGAKPQAGGGVEGPPPNSLEDMQNRLNRIDLQDAKQMTAAESRSIVAAAKESGVSGLREAINSWKSKYSDRFSAEVAEEYAKTRRQELVQLLENSGVGALERDAENSTARAMKLVGMALNGHAKHESEKE